MIICFWSPGHIGDTYIDAVFLHYLCKINNNIQFYYYYIQGDVFFNNIPNLKRIYGKNEYTHTLINGMPPEYAQDVAFIKHLYDNVGIFTHHKVLTINSSEILFVNTWCNPMGFRDFELSSAIPAWKNAIELLNNTYRVNLKFNEITAKELISCFNITNPIIEPSIDNFINSVNDKKLFFIYNYQPRSLQFEMNKLNSYIYEIAKNADNFIILATENKEFNMYPNIKCCETDFKINKQLSCNNLLQLWNIAKKCNTVVIIPSGSSWTFFHNLDDLKNINVCMFNSQVYTDRLNANIQQIYNDNSYTPIQNC
jgi:hypothetical protein